MVSKNNKPQKSVMQMCINIPVKKLTAANRTLQLFCYHLLKRRAKCLSDNLPFEDDIFLVSDMVDSETKCEVFQQDVGI